MLGTEKRVRATHGEGVDDETLAKYRNSGSLAFVAFVLAVGALLLGIAQYTDLAGNAATSANSAAIAAARNQIAALQGRLDALERASQDERAMIVDSIVSDMGAKAAFLAGQGLSQDQMDKLRQSLAPVLPQASADQAAPPDQQAAPAPATDKIEAKPEPAAPVPAMEPTPSMPETTQATPPEAAPEATADAPAPETATKPAPNQPAPNQPATDQPATDQPADATAQ